MLRQMLVFLVAVGLGNWPFASHAQQFSQDINLGPYGFSGWMMQAPVGDSVYAGPAVSGTPRIGIATSIYAPFHDIHFYKVSETAADFRVILDLSITNRGDRNWNGILISLINAQLPDGQTLEHDEQNTSPDTHVRYAHFHSCAGKVSGSSHTNANDYGPCFQGVASFELYEPTGIPGVDVSHPGSGPPSGVLIRQAYAAWDPSAQLHPIIGYIGLRMHVIGPDNRAVLRISPILGDKPVRPPIYSCPNCPPPPAKH